MKKKPKPTNLTLSCINMNHPVRLNRRFCLLACPPKWRRRLEKGGWKIPAANRRGSILIWSVLLGFLLTSVFFFFSMRQRATITVQRDTVAILNARAYLESYADYIELLDEAELNSLISSGADFDDDIIGTVTNVVDKIDGIADTGVPVQYTFTNKEIYIEWNKCSENIEGDLRVNNAIYRHDADSVCGIADEGYDDVIGPITVTNPTIETLNAPFYYRITGTDLTDSKWHLELSTELHFGKKITVKRTFQPNP